MIIFLLFLLTAWITYKVTDSRTWLWGIIIVGATLGLLSVIYSMAKLSGKAAE